MHVNDKCEGGLSFSWNCSILVVTVSLSPDNTEKYILENIKSTIILLLLKQTLPRLRTLWPSYMSFWQSIQAKEKASETTWVMTPILHW